MIGKLGKKQKAFLTAAVLIAMASPVYAADTDTVKTRDVVVTASRTEQEVKAAPSAVEVITAEDIENMGAETLHQALQLAAGIDVLENSMVGSKVSLRGMDTNQTLILIDGRRVRTEDTDETQNYYELGRVNVDDVERVEIVRGATSSLYGSEALGGVINIITKKPGTRGGSVTADWTSRRSDVGVNMDFGKQGKWAWSTSFKLSDLRERMGDEASSMYGNNYYFSLDGRMDISNDKNLDFFFDYLREDWDQLSSTKYKQSSVYDNRRYSTGLKYSGKDSHGDYEMQVYYSQLDKKQKTRYYEDVTTRSPKMGPGGMPIFIPGTFMPVFEYNTFEAGSLADFDDMTFESLIVDGKRTLYLGDSHTLTVGGEYRNESYDSTRIGDGSLSETFTIEGITKEKREASVDYAALYAQDEWQANDRWLLIPSVRWDYSSSFGSEVTGKLGSTYQMSKNSRFKANIGTAYRAPTTSELYMNMDKPMGGMRVHVYGNEDLKPEKSFNIDLGFEAEKDNASMKVSYFRNKVDDLIESEEVRDSETIAGVTHVYGRYFNVDKATLQGLELEGKQKLGNGFTLREVYTYLDARDDNTDARLTGRARHKFSLQLNYADDNGWNATLWNDWLDGYLCKESSYGSSSSRIYSVSESILNFVVRKQITKDFSAYFGINNLTNQNNDDLYYDGRIWRGGVKWTF